MRAELLNDDSPESETTATCDTSQRAQHGFLPEATPANPQAWPANDGARKMTAGSGRRLLPLLKGVTTNGSCLRTLLESCLSTTEWNSSVSVLRWKAKGTKFNRLLFQLAVSEHYTGGIGYGLWPTPQGRDYRSVTGNEINQRDNALQNLNVAAKMWPTPHANASTGAGTQGRDGGLNLQTAARLWPTPTSRDHKDGSAESCRNVPVNSLLGRAVHLPTPTANRWDGLQSHGVNVISGQLNPTWVEWLMGYPSEWTDLDVSETPSSPKSPINSSSE